jgi:membrane associated rhomboid family serine protease
MARPPRDLVLGPFLIPRVLLALIAATLLASVASAALGAPLVLASSAVWAGQAWRLLSFGLVAAHPIGLVFGCLALYGFGRELYAAWGEAGLLRACAGLALGAALVTCVLGRLWPALDPLAFAGQWAVLGGLIVAWGRLFPGRALRWFGVVPMTGRYVVWATLGVTLLFVLFYGLAPFVPHVAAELLALAYMGPVRRWRARRLAARKAGGAGGVATAGGLAPAFRDRPETFEEWLAREWPRK